ncbi:MAG: hypothetical protein AAGF47_11520 [Planctomycetota bacterium]
MRLAAIVVLCLSAAAFGVAGWFMVQRVVEYNRTDLPARPYFHPVDRPEFEFAGTRVIFTHESAEDAALPGTVVIRFGQDEVRVREQVANLIDPVPDLRRFEEWLRVYRMIIPPRGTTPQQALDAVERDELDDRLVIVAVRPPAGADDAWGRVWVEQYQFDIHELTEDGRIVSERWRYPGDLNEDGTVPEGELIEGTWQYDAAMQSLPPIQRAEPEVSQNASLALGWTFPVAGVAALTLMGSLVLFLISGPPNREPEPVSGASSSAA